MRRRGRGEEEKGRGERKEKVGQWEKQLDSNVENKKGVRRRKERRRGEEKNDNRRKRRSERGGRGEGGKREKGSWEEKRKRKVRREGTTEEERREEDSLSELPSFSTLHQTYSVVLNGYDSTSSAVGLSLYCHHVNVVWKLEMEYLEEVQLHIKQSINKLVKSTNQSLNQSIIK